MKFDLVKNTILLTVAGSRAYNLHQEDSDIDVKGVCIPSKEYFLGYCDNFGEADKLTHVNKFINYLSSDEKKIIANEKLEGSVYGILKFFKLATDNNPNILDILFCRDEEIRLITPEGNKIRENANLFLSTKCRWTFSGYSRAQLKRINTHRKWLLNPVETPPKRSDFDLPEIPEIPKNQLEAAFADVRKKIDSWEIDFGQADDALKIYVQNQIAEYLAEVKIGSDEKFASACRLIGYDENMIHLLQKEREFKVAYSQWESYQEWKENRNPKRAALEALYGYDPKHAAHLVRLMRMCREILEKGEVNVWRHDGEELRAIRNGAWSYDQLIEFADAEDKAMDHLYKTSPLPRSPNFTKLNELCMEIVESHIKRN